MIRDEQKIVRWLEDHNLGCYVDNFLSNGYDDWELIHHLNETDLDHMKIFLPGHRKKILLLAKKSDSVVSSNLSNELAETFLHAAGTGSVEYISSLLNSNRNLVHYRSKDGSTALHQACNAGQKRVCKVLVSHGADVNATNDLGWTPLHLAALTGKFNVCK